jgi:hypothetical protein
MRNYLTVVVEKIKNNQHFIAVLHFSHSGDLNNEHNLYPKISLHSSLLLITATSGHFYSCEERVSNDHSKHTAVQNGMQQVDIYMRETWHSQDTTHSYFVLVSSSCEFVFPI